MYQIASVKPLDNYVLQVIFTNGEKRYKDIKELLQKPVFQPLCNKAVFEQVKVINGAISWVMDDGLEVDLCPDNTYFTSSAD